MSGFFVSPEEGLKFKNLTFAFPDKDGDVEIEVKSDEDLIGNDYFYLPFAALEQFVLAVNERRGTPL